VAGPAEIIEAITASLAPLTVEITGLQITSGINPNPTPPSIDVYPADVSALPASQGGWEESFTVRARVSTPDDQAAQEVLMSLMDSSGPTSVIEAIKADTTFTFAVDERTGFQPYPGDYLGCEWRVRMIQ
jgi:hypothetical protein